jgi:hypothetical protein
MKGVKIPADADKVAEKDTSDENQSVFTSLEKAKPALVTEDDLTTSLSKLSVSATEAAKSTKASSTCVSDTETFISIDVEAAAIGRTHSYSDRAACWVVVIDSAGSELLNLVINVPNMVSPLTKVTGLTAVEIQAGIPLADAVERVQSLLCNLSTNVTLVGQSVQGDIDWLQLKKDIHYKNIVDLSESFKSWNARYSNWNFYSLAKEAYGLLNVRMHGASKHSPVVDAQVSMRLFMEIVAVPTKLAAAKQKLDQMTWKKLFPLELMASSQDRNIDGCCGWGFDPKKCKCGAPTLRST